MNQFLYKYTCTKTLYRFLLAKLHFDSIAAELRLATVRQALETLPEDLNNTYDETMKRIRNGQQKTKSDLAIKVLMLLSYALRPLKLDEVQHALLTMEAKPHETSIDRNDVYRKGLLLAICAGIAILEDETSAIRFVHHTAETYFKSNRERLFDEGHIELTKTCVTYLSFDEFGSGSCQTDTEFNQRLQLNQFYDYAANNWGHHARKASPLCQAAIDFLECKTKVEASSQALLKRRLARYLDSQIFSKKMTGVHLAAYFGVAEAVGALLQKGVETDAEDIYGRTPLSWAACYGHEAVVKLLLETGKVDLESKDTEYGQTPLSWAVRNGHESVVKLLLETGKVDLESTGRSGQTPLSWAARYGNKAVVKLLLETGKVDLESTDTKYCQTPLSWAAYNGHEAVVKLLLETGKVNLESTDTEYGQTPLLLAAYNGHAAVVKLLLETGKVDLDSMDTVYGQTPLSWAAQNGHEAVVKLLQPNTIY
jgi:ankyrin repeat protein